MSIAPWMMYGPEFPADLARLHIFVDQRLRCLRPRSACTPGTTTSRFRPASPWRSGCPSRAAPDVALTTSAQVPPGGGLACVIVTVPAARAARLARCSCCRRRARQRPWRRSKRVRTFIRSHAPVDHGNRLVGLVRDRRRSAASRNSRRKRLQTVREAPGSAISRRPSPSSLGMGRSCGRSRPSARAPAACPGGTRSG